MLPGGGGVGGTPEMEMEMEGLPFKYFDLVWKSRERE